LDGTYLDFWCHCPGCQQKRDKKGWVPGSGRTTWTPEDQARFGQRRRRNGSQDCSRPRPSRETGTLKQGTSTRSTRTLGGHGLGERVHRSTRPPRPARGSPRAVPPKNAAGRGRAFPREARGVGVQGRQGVLPRWPARPIRAAGPVGLFGSTPTRWKSPGRGWRFREMSSGGSITDARRFCCHRLDTAGEYADSGLDQVLDLGGHNAEELFFGGPDPGDSGMASRWRRRLAGIRHWGGGGCGWGLAATGSTGFYFSSGGTGRQRVQESRPDNTAGARGDRMVG